MLNILLVLEKEMGILGKESPFSIKCPFHKDDTPSLRIYPQSDDGEGSFYCWGCGKFGDGVDFVRFYRNISWHEAVEYVEQEYGVSLPGRGHQKRKDAHLSDYLKVIMSNQRFSMDPKYILALEVSIVKYLSGDQSGISECFKIAEGGSNVL